MLDARVIKDALAPDRDFSMMESGARSRRGRAQSSVAGSRMAVCVYNYLSECVGYHLPVSQWIPKLIVGGSPESQ